jgi:hypothetical protein
VSLLSASQLAAIQGVAQSGMTKTVSIYHGTSIKTDNGQKWGYPATPDLTALGWITELTPNSTKLDVINGQTSLSETHRMFLPIGTDCRSGDKVVSGSTTFIVQHTNSDDTYPAALTCAMRVQL